jgi:hypothetical protein
MDDEVDRVSYVESGYQTFESEAEAKHEAREDYRRRLLSCVRGRVRENKSLRWRIGFLMAGCIVGASALAAIPATNHAAGACLRVLAVMSMWPIYVYGLYACAKAESRHLDMAGHWDSHLIHDQLGEMNDRNVSEKIDRIVKNVWEGNRYQQGNQGGALLGFVVLTIATLGTWTIWDLLRMAPALVAEIIVDALLVPAHPALADRMPPTYPWWKNAFASTALHFLAIGLCVAGVLAVGETIPVIRAEHGGS